MLDYYKILELSFGAPSSEIKSAYRKLAFKYHPDKNFNDKVAEEKFKQITEAYYILSDENRRIIYHAEYN
ncbi:MAG TPA: DnaJ domain-containing protein, partial [Chitinophagales bacterium]|nr:DnaJ domain-containing protein [Chitinophagales bacterium]